MNAVAELRSTVPAYAMDETELIETLRGSLYPNAPIPMVRMVLNYCRAANLDPMQKPVHIVGMWNSQLGKMIDVVMPGIGLYRTQAARSGELAGVSEPEFGPSTTFTLDGKPFDAPEWCRVTVKRALRNGIIAEFTATEYWVENYAVKGGKEKSVYPNAMWQKRPRGQIAKCAQAQALRMAFPEMTGAAPTADEMEGREMDMGQVDEVKRLPAERPALPPYPQDQFDTNLPQWRALIAGGRDPARIIAMVSSKFVMTDEQKAVLNKPIDTVIDEEKKPAAEQQGADEE